jgi:hypothetical protein
MDRSGDPSEGMATLRKWTMEIAQMGLGFSNELLPKTDPGPSHDIRTFVEVRATLLARFDNRVHYT